MTEQIRNRGERTSRQQFHRSEASLLLDDGGNRETEIRSARSVNASDGHTYGSFPRTIVGEGSDRKLESGGLNVLSDAYESLDYDVCENTLLLEKERATTYNDHLRRDLARWLIMAMIGVFTGITAAAIDIAIEVISGFKYLLLKQSVDECVDSRDDCLYIPYLQWVGMNASAIFLASSLTVYLEPVAAGSGISQVKCYLNGVKIPRIVRIRTMMVKVVGVILSVVGGLAVGKEGPMIHAGAVIAAGVSQGKSTTFKKDFKIFETFRNDQEKRDFVSGGAAAGVSAAFGAPFGGVLFSLEEGASFWNQALTWRIFFSSLISTMTLNIILSTYHGRPGQLTYSGLLNFGQFDNITYSFSEVPLFLIMAVIGGLLGALFNYINCKLTVFRIRYMYRRWTKVLEAVLVATTTATVGFFMIYLLDDCKTLGTDPNQFPVQFHCGDGEYNALGAIWFQTPEASVRSLFHDPPGSHQPLSIGLFFLMYFMLSCWTYGLSVPSGLFIPSLLTGAAWGRMIGMTMEYFFPDKDWVDPGKYALVGAAAQLGGVVRMTISLTAIFIEATGNMTFGLPIMIVLMVSKWVGDYFNEGIYDMHIQLSSVPILAWEPPPLSNNIYAREIMSHPVTVLRCVEKVGRIFDVLNEETHNGFPLVAEPEQGHGENSYESIEDRTFGRFQGVILRPQLIVLLQKKAFDETTIQDKLTLADFRDAYPRYPSIDQVNISEYERNFTIDLRPYCNPAPYTVQSNSTLPRIFRLVRGLGLRHLVVVNECNEVVGMVTRKDLARYRFKYHRGQYGLEELNISHG